MAFSIWDALGSVASQVQGIYKKKADEETQDIKTDLELDIYRRATNASLQALESYKKNSNDEQDYQSFLKEVNGNMPPSYDGLTDKEKAFVEQTTKRTANQIYLKHKDVVNGASSQISMTRFNKAYNTNLDMVKNGTQSLEDGLAIYDKTLMPSFKASLPSDAKDFGSSELRAKRSDLIASGILAMPRGSRGDMLEKYKSELDPMTYQNTLTQIVHDTETHNQTEGLLLDKLTSGQFASADDASAYIKSHRVSPSFTTYYNAFQRVKSLNPSQLDAVAQDPANARYKQLIEDYKQKVTTGINNNLVDWIHKTGAQTLPSIDFNNPNVEVQLAEREARVRNLEKRYHVPAKSFFTTEEASALKRLYQNDSPEEISDLLNKMPKDAMQTGELDTALFQGASWLASQSQNGAGADKTTGVSMLTDAVRLAQQMKSDKRVASDMKEVHIATDMRRNLEASLGHTNLINSAITGMRMQKYINNNFTPPHDLTKRDDNTYVEGGFFRRLGNKLHITHPESQKYFMVNNNKGIPSVVYAPQSDVGAREMIRDGAGEYLRRFKIKAFASDGEEISTDEIFKHGQFVNLGLDKYGIAYISPTGQKVILRDKNGNIISSTGRQYQMNLPRVLERERAEINAPSNKPTTAKTLPTPTEMNEAEDGR